MFAANIDSNCSVKSVGIEDLHGWTHLSRNLHYAHLPAPQAIRSGGAPDIGAGPDPNSQVSQPDYDDDDDDDDDSEWDTFHPLPMPPIRPPAPWDFCKPFCPAWPDNFSMVRLQMCTHLHAQPIIGRLIKE